MKTINLLILAVLFIMLSSCNKMEDAATSDFEVDGLSTRYLSDKSYPTKPSIRLRIRNMTFEQFKDTLKIIRLDREKSTDILPVSNRFVVASGPLDGFVPAPCFSGGLTGADSIAFCRQEWLWDCYNFCEQKFYDDVSELDTDDQSAQQNYQLALLRCNNEPPGIGRDLCIAIADREYEDAMNEIEGRYRHFQQHWMVCDEQCTSNFSH